jgi:hypothetical protein
MVPGSSKELCSPRLELRVCQQNYGSGAPGNRVACRQKVLALGTSLREPFKRWYKVALVLGKVRHLTSDGTRYL